MSSLDGVFVENIRLSNLEMRKKERILDMLSSAPSKDLTFQKLDSNDVLVTFRVSLRSEAASHREHQVSQHTPLSKYVQAKRKESVLQKPEGPRAVLSGRSRGASHRQPPSQPGGTSRRQPRNQFVRGKPWVLKLLQEIFNARFSLFSTEIATPEGKLESFSSFVFSTIQSKFGLARLVKQTTQELLESVKYYSKTDSAIELFGLFLTPYYSVRDLMFFLYVRSVVINELFAKERPQSVLRKTYFEMDIPGDRLRSLMKKALLYQPRVLKRACFNELGKARHFKPTRRMKRSQRGFRTGARVLTRSGLKSMSINTFCKILLEEYRKVAPNHYTLQPTDVPYYHRVRDKSVRRYIILRKFSPEGRPGPPQQRTKTRQQLRRMSVDDDENLLRTTRSRQRSSSSAMRNLRHLSSPIFVDEDQIANHIRRENYDLSFSDADGHMDLPLGVPVGLGAFEAAADKEEEPEGEFGRRSRRVRRGPSLPTGDQELEELLRTSGTPEEMLLFPSTRRSFRQQEQGDGRSDDRDDDDEGPVPVDDLFDGLSLPTFNDNLEGVALADEQIRRRLKRKTELMDEEIRRREEQEDHQRQQQQQQQQQTEDADPRDPKEMDSELPFERDLSAILERHDRVVGETQVRVGRLIDLTRSGIFVNDGSDDKTNDLVDQILNEDQSLNESIKGFELGVQQRLGQKWDIDDEALNFRLPVASDVREVPSRATDDGSRRKRSTSQTRREIEDLVRNADLGEEEDRGGVKLGEVQRALDRLDDVAPEAIDKPRSGSERDAASSAFGNLLSRPDDFAISSFREFLDDGDDISRRKTPTTSRDGRRPGSESRRRSSGERDRRRSREDTKSLIYRLKRDLDLNSLVFSLQQPESDDEGGM